MSSFLSIARSSAIAAGLSVVATACAGGSGSGTTTPQVQSAPQSESAETFSPDAAVSVLKQLKKRLVIGSTIDPKFGQLNPYGLSVAPSTAGGMKQGDLVVCNFNAKSNVQGTGYTIVALHPAPGSKPALISSNRSLAGCNALALSPGDFIWAAAFKANDNPVLNSSGGLLEKIAGKPLDRPWGQIYAPATNASASAAFYESNAGNGTIVRFNLSTNAEDVIATGFAVNHGKPGSIFGPSGLSYDAKSDTLYVVDGTNDTVTALSKVSTIPARGVTVEKNGTSFGGPSAMLARSIYAGAPLNGPISSALLYNGNLVVGNTSDPTGKNLMVELSSNGKVLDVENVDTGAAGAIFGMVATGDSAATTKVYFNDDNANNLQVLER